MSNKPDDALALLADMGLDEYVDMMQDNTSLSQRGKWVRQFNDAALLAGGVYHLAGDEVAIIDAVRGLGDDVLFVQFDDVATIPKNRECISLSCLDAIDAIWSADIANTIVLTPGFSLQLSDENKPMLAHAMQWLRVRLSEVNNPPVIIILDPFIDSVPSPVYRTLRQFSDLTL